MTLFTSDIKKIYFYTLITYICATILTFVFHLVYSQFSHGVSSDAMTYAFIYPLSGVVVYGILYFVNYYERVSYNTFNAAVATVTMGSLLLGVNEIAGADSIYYNFFYLGACILFGITIFFARIYKII